MTQLNFFQTNHNPAFRKGDRDDITVVIVLSCPGQAEEKAGRPAAKQTGKNLQCAVEILNERFPSRFPSKRLDDYTIANSVEDIHYKELTGRTEATDAEILKEDNIERIKGILQQAHTVIALGAKAGLAVSAAGYCGALISGGHPSMTKVNTTYKSNKPTSQERHKDRICQWVADLSYTNF